MSAQHQSRLGFMPVEGQPIYSATMAAHNNSQISMAMMSRHNMGHMPLTGTVVDGYTSYGLDATANSAAATAAAAGAEVRAVFSEDPALLEWVTTVPSQSSLMRFKHWASRLSGIISNEPPPDIATMPGNPGWLHSMDAAHILAILETSPVSLRLLELTHISKPVAMLRGHQDTRVAELANRVTHRWRNVAHAALTRATAALQAHHHHQGVGVVH